MMLFDPFNPTGAGGNYSNNIIVYNRSNQQINISSITLEFGSLGSTNKISSILWPGNTSVNVNSATSPVTSSAPSGTSIAANSSITIRVDYNYKPSTTPLT